MYLGSTPSVSMMRSRGSGGEGAEEEVVVVVVVVVVVGGSVGEMRCQRPRRPYLRAAAATGGTGLVDDMLEDAAVLVSDICRRC